MTWEAFCDESYFGLWCVRPAGERRWGHCFHVQTEEEANGLKDILNGYEARLVKQNEKEVSK